jgi:monofunctional biosynthetic peptidoglycan transglycosylase
MRLKVRLRRLARLLGQGLLALAVSSLVVVVLLRWLDPPFSAFMARDWVGGWWEGREPPWVNHEWVDLEAIAPAMGLAVIAAEDQRFPVHSGFDLVQMEKAWRELRQGQRVRGASTISQQVAKNLFLWRGKSLMRKGLEAWFTVWIELAWPKRRILEIYLNIAELGPATYGVGAASWRYFRRPPAALTKEQAALLAAVLPNPELYRADAPSAYVRKRAAWVRRQMGQLGAGYLKGLAGQGNAGDGHTSD